MLPLVDIRGIWHLTYVLGLSGLLVFTACRQELKNVPPIARVFWLYFSILCIVTLEFPNTYFGPYTPYVQSTAGQAFAEVTLICSAAYALRRWIAVVMPFVALFSAVCVWFNWSGFFHAPSFNMAFAATCLPLIVIDPNKVSFAKVAAWVFICGTALTHHGTTALLILVSHHVVAAFKDKKYYSLGVMAFLAWISAKVFHGPFDSGHERLVKWGEYMTPWSQESWDKIVFGIGPGSFMWYSILKNKYQTGIYLQMHNEFLQILWENGVVGFGLALAVCYKAIRRVREDAVLLQGVAGCIVFSLTYCPLRYFPSALLIAYFFTLALIPEDESNLCHVGIQ